MNVLITFYSVAGDTEKLALAAAVGAVQARAAVRVRRLPPMADEQPDVDPTALENQQRMEREYVAPKQADARWADVIIVGMPARLNIHSRVIWDYFDSLRSLEKGEKVGAVFVSNGAPAAAVLEALQVEFAQLGFKMISPASSAIENPESARLFGRHVAELAQESSKSPSAEGAPH